MTDFEQGCTWQSVLFPTQGVGIFASLTKNDAARGDAIETVLGYHDEDGVIHRDNWVILGGNETP